jgi:hypothetical protein
LREVRVMRILWTLGAAAVFSKSSLEAILNAVFVCC